jgi:hypothetical protein
LSPNRLKRKAGHLKSQAILREMHASAWRDRRADFAYEFKPTIVEDGELSSRMLGPTMRTIQWDPSSCRYR